MKKKIPLVEAERLRNLKNFQRWARATSKRIERDRREGKLQPDTDYDPQKWVRDELRRLQQEYEEKGPGYHLALNDAFLLCAGKMIPRWAVEGLTEKLRSELKSSKQGKKRTVRQYKQLARWDTFNWFRRQGCGWNDAKRLAAQAFGKVQGGDTTIKHAYEDHHKKYNLPSGLPPIERGGENVTPADLLEGPDERTLMEVLAKYKALKSRAKN